MVEFEIRNGEAVMRPAGRTFMDFFASIPPRLWPEDWHKVKEQVWEQVAREIVEEMR